MHFPRRALLAGLFANVAQHIRAAVPGGFELGGDTKVSAMMVFLGSEKSVYILDKAEANAAQIKGHPAWGAVWDIETHQSVVQDVRSNSFCAAGMHLPNGSYVTFGGNDGVTTGGKVGSVLNPDGTGAWDAIYQDFDGRRAIRIVNPCTIHDNLDAGDCAWYDEPTVLSMKRNRWYASTEATGDGRVVIIGGFVSGGFINRWYPNDDPATSRGLAEPTYEFYPPEAGEPRRFEFMVQTSGLNAYAHTFLMPSGRFFVQANLSSVLWDFDANTETALPPMPGNIARVYPASGATALLPLTPANKWTPTVLFCGGADLPDEAWGDYTGPFADVWEIPASRDCQRITPEPSDGSAAQYVKDDDMPEGRSMGQFIILPDGKMLVINGGERGTAGYSLGTRDTPLAQMPFGPSLATDPVMTPAIYDPNAPAGQRWSKAGLKPSTIPRLYHSSAILLPDASVFVAGSNPNPDVDLNAHYPTEYRADIFYPPYFSAKIRPAPVASTIPKRLPYGGQPFDIMLTHTSYEGSTNDAAASAQVVIVRGGFTTHAMNMGQRMMQLENSYTVMKNGSFVLHVSPPPPNSNLFAPGPALLFVNIKGIPSNGTYVIVGNGVIGTQETSPAVALPPAVRLDGVTSASFSSSGGKNGGGSSGNGSGDGGESSGPGLGLIIGAAAGGVAILAIVGGLIAFCLARRRRASRAPTTTNTSNIAAWSSSPGHGHSGSSAGLVKGNNDWDASTTNLTAMVPQAPYKDSEQYSMSSRGSGLGQRPSENLGGHGGGEEYDPYAAQYGQPGAQGMGYGQGGMGYAGQGQGYNQAGYSDAQYGYQGR